jgi:hypothetical protein
MTRAVSGRCLVRNNNLNRRAVALPYRSRKVPLLSTTTDTSFPSFIAFATIPSAVDLRSRTWVYPAFSSFQINSCSAALTCEEPVVLWSVGGRVDGVVLGCASAGNVIAKKEATVQAANRQLMMHSPEYVRAGMAPHSQPTLGRVVPAHVVVPLRLWSAARSSTRHQVMAAATLSPHPSAHPDVAQGPSTKHRLALQLAV